MLPLAAPPPPAKTPGHMHQVNTLLSFCLCRYWNIERKACHTSCFLARSLNSFQGPIPVAAPEENLRPAAYHVPHQSPFLSVTNSVYSRFSWRLPYLALGRGRHPPWPQRHEGRDFHHEHGLHQRLVTTHPSSTQFIS